jgi:hypothetical protein
MSRSAKSVRTVNERHEALQERLAGADEVLDITTRCDGPRTDTAEPTFRTEITLSPAADGIGPVVLEAIADCGLSLIPQPPQGGHTIVYAE